MLILYNLDMANDGIVTRIFVRLVAMSTVSMPWSFAATTNTSVGCRRIARGCGAQTRMCEMTSKLAFV